jgi:hypothetical protein
VSAPRPGSPRWLSEDDLSADDVDQEELATILGQLIEDTDPPGGFLAAVAQLLTAAARRAEQIEPDRDGDASCPLHEAAVLITDDAGQRLHRAARPPHPQGDRMTAPYYPQMPDIGNCG